MQIAEWGHTVATKQLTDNNFMSALSKIISNSQPQENKNQLMQIAKWGNSSDSATTKQLVDNNFMSAAPKAISDSQLQETNQLIEQLRQLSGVNEPPRAMYFPDPVVPGDDLRRTPLAGRRSGPGGKLTTAYSLRSSASSINEGQTVTFTLTTIGLADGTNVPYTITGIHYGDIGGFTPLTGNFVVNSGTASVTFTLSADGFTEGLEKITLTLDSILPVVKRSVSIVDTSQSYPGSQTFILTSDVESVDNNNVFSITLTTTYVADQTPIFYNITGVDSADIAGASLSGYFYVNSSYVNGQWNTGTATISFTSTKASTNPKTFELNIFVGAENVFVTLN